MAPNSKLKIDLRNFLGAIVKLLIKQKFTHEFFVIICGQCNSIKEIISGKSEHIQEPKTLLETVDCMKTHPHG